MAYFGLKNCSHRHIFARETALWTSEGRFATLHMERVCQSLNL